MSMTPFTRRWPFQLANLMVYLAALLVIGICLNVVAQRSVVRARIDATKTQAYSLSEQTESLLASLAGDWTVAVILDESEADRSVRRQLEQVLTRFQRVAPSLEIVNIDPSTAESLRAYESLLGRLRGLYAGETTDYESALDEGDRALRRLVEVSRSVGVPLGNLVAAVPAGDPMRADLDRRVGLLAILATQAGDAIIAEVNKARRPIADRPVADYEGARSILAGALTQWSQEIYDTADAVGQVLRRQDIPMDLRAGGGPLRQTLEELSQDLARSADPLRRLPPHPLASIGVNLERGEAAVIIGNGRAAVIPSEQLFPKGRLRNDAGRGVTFDQRFRGEQLLAATIRSLLIDQLPMVVFMHAEPSSLLATSPRDIDLVGVYDILRASRFEVVEWAVDRGEAPRPDDGQPVVWVVIPPSAREGLQTSDNEKKLINATRTLIGRGASVLLSVQPSLLPTFGQIDPWVALSMPFDLVPDTGRVVHEQIRVSEDEVQVERGASLLLTEVDHPVAGAVKGLQTYLVLPIPIRFGEVENTALRRTTLHAIEPSDDRWLATDWNRDPSQQRVPPPEGRLREPAPVVVAAERQHPTEPRMQRFMLVGSGSWMLSYVADLAAEVGGDRFALVNPGNHELMLASIAWLAGQDELIAPSPATKEVARLAGLSAGARSAWFWLCLAVLPGLSLSTGLLVWWRRTSS